MTLTAHMRPGIARDRAMVQAYLAGVPLSEIGHRWAITRAQVRAGCCVRRRPKSLRDPRCVCCGADIPRHPTLDTEQTWRSRALCSRACERKTKMTQADKGRASWAKDAMR